MVSLFNGADTVSLAVTTAVFYEYGLTWTREPGGHTSGNNLGPFKRGLVRCGKSCSLLVWCSEIYAVIALLIITLLSALRVYALWYGTVWPSLLVVMCGLILPFVSIAIMTLCVREALSNPVACNPSLHAGTTAFAVYFAARAIGIVSDILVVAFTWVKARRLMASTRAVGFTAYVPEALLRFGLHYFAPPTERVQKPCHHSDHSSKRPHDRQHGRGHRV
ncbi:uncharacterized protein C8Q71DRAFT_72284 [Rhodofomes roseus]|uniref:Transmembrane protein n=1 Tax=Rhodofomes roseus TaxID=34475 RepID=A0ABQ8KF24_9APHY|nr:uncharacterized protein C8Q71DRAFT_72284 [Rhodofomes roseus]KAH9836224.1 hypothetical protein C8Q71DRAFT_72284 [Rhodofomes roseus]